MVKTNEESFEIPYGQAMPLTGKINHSADNVNWVFLCRGLTGNLSRRSSLDVLSDKLGKNKWSSLRFDYRNSLCPESSEILRTTESMTEDVSNAFAYLKQKTGKLPDIIIARGLGARLVLKAIIPYPQIPIIMWAPIIWFKTSMELRYRMHEFRRKRQVKAIETEIGASFMKSIEDPKDEELQSWIVPQRQHIIMEGKDDKVVPNRLAEEFKELISSVGAKVELIIMEGNHPDVDNNVTDQIQIEEIVKKISNMN